MKKVKKVSTDDAFSFRMPTYLEHKRPKPNLEYYDSHPGSGRAKDWPILQPECELPF